MCPRRGMIHQGRGATCTLGIIVMNADAKKRKRSNPIQVRRVLAWILPPTLILAWLTLSACQHSEAPKTTSTQVSPTPQPQDSVPASPPATLFGRNDSDDWLFIEKVRPDTPDGWARGTFDKNRNKIAVETNGALGFALDIERIPIDWERLVVIRIDGKNSELRKRDYSRYHFQRDKYGRWIVAE